MNEHKDHIPPPIPKTEAENDALLDSHFTAIERAHREAAREANKSFEVKNLEKEFKRSIELMKGNMKKRITKAFEAFGNSEITTKRGEIVNINHLKEEIFKAIEEADKN
jgi:hypothetical protein